jgi:hypothetical protein
MKCDTCKHEQCEQADMGNGGNAMPYCAKEHWSGIDPSEPMPEIDPWRDCKDYEENE